MRPLIVSAILAIVVCASPGVVPPVAAQPGTASLSGRVLDAQRAAARGATVTLRSRATGASWTATSDAEGRFRFSMLPPGPYQLAVTLAGFARWERDAVTLQVGQDYAFDVPLAVAGVKEDVVVRGENRVLTTAVDGVIAGERIESLPLNGRNFLELALLVPGNTLTPLFDPTKANRVLIGSAGQLGRGGNITIDGQDNNDDVVGGPLLNLPIDAVQEFQIATNRFGAELGHSASSSINVITRSGTNTRHGSGSLFARDDAWQALPSTADDPDLSPPFDRQQTSGAFGGPLRRDRTFWFAAGEYRHQNGGVLVGTRNSATRTVTRSFAPAPLRDSLWSLRIDTGGSTNRLTARYAGESGTDTSASAIERAIGSATQRQEATNRYHHVLGSWTSAPNSGFVNALTASVSTFLNETLPVAAASQLTFPSLQDGASFRMPQRTTQTRLQFSDSATFIRGAHSLRVGGELHQIYGEFNLGVFQQGRIELVEDFPAFDHTGDGRIDDNDLLFAVTLRSGKPTQSLDLPDSNNTHIAGFAQDDWRVGANVQVNAGLRYEIDTDVNNQSRVDELNAIVQPFVRGERRRDLNNLAPRVGLAWNVGDALLVRGGYGIYYDRIVLQIQSLERGLDGRALPIEVRAGNVLFLDANGRLPPFAPTLASPFTGFILPGAGASGINIIDPHLQNPMVHEFHLGVERTLLGARARLDAVHSAGRHFLIGRTVGDVFNPVVGGPDRVVNIESSARTKYDALLVSANRAFSDGYSVQLAYTLAKAFNDANDDQIPFLGGPIDPTDLAREFGPTPHDRRHRFVASGQASLPGGVTVSAIWTLSSGVPMDIMMPDGQSRVPVLQRNAGGRLFRTPAELNAFISSANASGGIDGELLPLVSDEARFSDTFNSLDFRLSRLFTVNRSRVRIEPLVEVFNLFNVTNILGVSNVNYSGFANVLVRDSEEPGSLGYLRSSAFGRAVTTAGGVFGSGGPRAMQLGARVTF